MQDLFKVAIERGASDIHIKAGDVVRARINGLCLRRAWTLSEGLAGFAQYRVRPESSTSICSCLKASFRTTRI